jgi:hypothetical protein
MILFFVFWFLKFFKVLEDATIGVLLRKLVFEVEEQVPLIDLHLYFLNVK